MKKLCLFCGSKSGNRPEYAQLAEQLGRATALAGYSLVYGGGRVGLMGIAADACLAAGGEVIGIIPQQLVDWEAAHHGLTRLEVVTDMAARKARMFELADAIVTLPGGFGTLDEIFEILTYRQLGIAHQPCAFLDVNAFWQPLMLMLDHQVESGFLPSEHRDDIWHGENVDVLMQWLKQYDGELIRMLALARRDEVRRTPHPAG